MKKILLTLVILCTLQVAVQAQNVKGKDAKTRIEKKAISKTVLGEQLTKKFGASYSLTSTEVKAQLNKNIDNKEASYELRKLSLMALYGDEAHKHVSRMKR